MNRYICIHAHCYQPPREHPWLESIEVQDSAYPFHDWNERVTAECYRPNTHSRILDNKGHVKQIVNNYTKINFNFGPTLLNWMEEKAPDVYSAILEADHESQKIFSGHGSAIAQVYNHIIMPLASKRDKETQIIWGIRDFEARFQRYPEGMWLSETAVDLETLELLAEHGIKYTILAPRQAKRIRPLNSENWQNVAYEKIDPTRAYQINLPSGQHLILFFYDGPISRGIAFENLLENGETLANRIIEGFDNKRSWPQIVHIATDGETYGHHHKHGDMALAYALHHIEENKLAQVTIYADYLAKHPPEYEVEIFENSSWSCVHGIERWRSNCGCHVNPHPHWNQKWRKPLREAFDFLSEKSQSVFETEIQKYTTDPWQLRNKYIDIILNRSEDNIKKFLSEQINKTLPNEELMHILKLLEMQRYTLYIFTSCAWFFDEISGLEAVQNLQYAGRVIDLAHDTLSINLEADFLRILENAKSNIPMQNNGKLIYERFVKPRFVDLLRVAAHHAVSSMFSIHEEQSQIYCYRAQLNDHQIFETGIMKLSLGHGKVNSVITLEESEFTFSVIHFGDHNLQAGVRVFENEEIYSEMVKEMSHNFLHTDIAATIRSLDKHFNGFIYTLKSLFEDEKRKILEKVLNSTLQTVERTYYEIYKRHQSLILYLSDIHNPLLNVFKPLLEFTKNKEIEKLLESTELHKEKIEEKLNEIENLNIPLDQSKLSQIVSMNLDNKMILLQQQPGNLKLLRDALNTASIANSLPFFVNLRQSQDIFYDIMQEYYEQASHIYPPDTEQKEWLDDFHTLGEQLSIHVPS